MFRICPFFVTIKEELEAGTVHPRDAKMKLAFHLVQKYYDEQTAMQAEQNFRSVFQNNQLPTDIEEKEVSLDLLDEEGQVWIAKLLVSISLVSSLGEGKRMVQQGAVKINEQKLEDINAMIIPESGMIIQVGKRKFAKIK